MFGTFDAAPAAGPITILSICTGNVCRSPLAAQLLTKELGEYPAKVRSAGTHALVGGQVPQPSLEIAASLGLDFLAAHRGRQLLESDVSAADLILTATREHRREVVQLVPKSSKYTFTFRELARLGREIPLDSLNQRQLLDRGARMREAIEFLARFRGTVSPPARVEDDDVLDPYNQPKEIYTESAEQLIPAVHAVADLLRSVANSKRRGGESR